MAEIRWTLQAADDLEEIARHIATGSPHYASLFAFNIVTTADRLTTFPNSGSHVKDLDVPNLREVIFRNYRIVYRYREADELVEILTVIHGARLLDPSKLK